MRSQGSVKTCLEFGFVNLCCWQVELACQCLMKESVLDLNMFFFTVLYSSLSIVLTRQAALVLFVRLDEVTSCEQASRGCLSASLNQWKQRSKEYGACPPSVLFSGNT